MIKIVLKKSEKTILCSVKLVTLVLLVGSSLLGMHGAGDMNSVGSENSETKQDIAEAQEAAIAVHGEQDPVAHWDRVSGDLLTPSNIRFLEREYSKEQLGAALSLLQHSPEGAMGLTAQNGMLPILAELHKQNNQRQELAESKISMNCTACSWWWLLNWSSRAAWVVFLSMFSTRFQCPK